MVDRQAPRATSTASGTGSTSSGDGAPGISGRKLTLALLLALLAVGGSLSYVLWTYNQVDREQRASEQAWLVLADLIDQRYRRQEATLTRQVDAGKLDTQIEERFRLALDRFRSTAQPEVQRAAAEEIEAILVEAGRAEPPDEKTLQALHDYNQRVAEFQQQMSSPGAAVLKRLLRLPNLRQFSFQTSNSAIQPQGPDA